MSDQAEIIRIAIASPSDLVGERDAIPRTFNRWNHAHEGEDVHISPIMWETSSVPELGNHPQHILDRQIIERADLLVALFWTRIGSPTPTAASGTIEEIREFVQQKGPGRAMVYFCVRPVRESPDEIDTDAIRALQEFKTEMRSQGLYKQFKETAEFERDLYFDLDVKVKELRKGLLPLPGSGGYEDEIWWDADAADERLRAPFDVGVDIVEISSRFEARMDNFDKEEGATNNKFLKLAEHTYRSIARAIDLQLHIQPSKIHFSFRRKLEQVVSDLRRLSDDIDLYVRRPFPDYWEKGREISNRLTDLAKRNDVATKGSKF